MKQHPRTRTAVAQLGILIVMLLPSAEALGQNTPSEALEADIRELMAMTGAGNVGVQVMNQMLAPMQQARPGVPAEFWDRFMEKVDPGELVDMTVPIYARHFTHEEIKELVAFYKTPLGQKVIATLPAVMQESMAAGQKWGEELGRKIANELRAEGYR